MDPIPKVILSNFVWKIPDDGIHSISPASRLKCCFTGDGDSTSAIARLTWNSEGYWWLGRELRLALPARECIIVHVLYSTEDARGDTTLGSTYIELDQVFRSMNGSPSTTELSYTSVLVSNDSPSIQLTFSVAPFIPAADLVLPTRPHFSSVSKPRYKPRPVPSKQLRFDAYSTLSILHEYRLYQNLPSTYKLSYNMPDLDMAVTSLRSTPPSAPWFSPERKRPAEVSTLMFATGRRMEQLPSEAQYEWQVALQGFHSSMEYLMLESPLSQTYFFLRLEISQIKLWQGGPEAVFAMLESGIKSSEDAIASSNPSADLLSEKHSLAALLFLLCEARELEAFCPLSDRIIYITRVIDLLRECLRTLTASGYSFSFTVTDGSGQFVSREAWTPPGLNAADQPRDTNHLRELLGSALWIRFGFLKERRDLDEAITFLSSVPLDHSETTVFKLAGMLYERYLNHERDHQDIQQAICVLSSVATSPKGAPTKRFFAAFFWAECAEAVDDASSRMIAFKTAMSIITNVVWIGMAMQDRHDILTMTLASFGYAGALAQSRLRCMQDDIGHIPGLAAACAIQHGEYHTAIEWLEQGRSIIWDQLLQLRAPLEDLKGSNRPLAEKLAGIARELAISSAQTRFGMEGTNTDFKMLEFLEGDSRGQIHKQLSMEWEMGITEARSLPGHAKFLRPKEFDDLLSAARDSTVVIINFDTDRCDALVIFPPDDSVDAEGDRILHVPLSKVKGFLHDIGKLYAELLDLTRSSERKLVAKPWTDWDPEVVFMEVLSVLWNTIVFPILNSCRDARPRLLNSMTRPGIRWCPTGPLTFLPLHAAGDYSVSAKGHKVYDFVVSSYIPTLSSIVRPESPMRRGVKGKPQILAVSCATPKGYAPIFGTQRELRSLKAHAASSACQLVEVEEENATADRVMEEIKDAQWIHFACHGIQDATSPTQSALILQNSTRVTLADFAALNIPNNAELAYLSACQTATGYDAVPSESIHLAAGVLLAGYRSVIATMWSIQDLYAPEIADNVYGYLLRGGEAGVPDYRESAIALDRAVQRLREKVGEKAFMSWVPYIHMGA